MFNYFKKTFLIFLILNLTFISTVKAEATFNDINGDGTGFDVSAQDTTPRGIAFNNDGTKMFVVGDTGNDINSYTLSTGFLYKKETKLAFEVVKEMTSNFRISRALDLFELEFNLENDFSNQENNNANLSLSSKF